MDGIEAAAHRRICACATAATNPEAAMAGCGVAVLIPCLNEAQTVGTVVDGFRKALPQADIYVYDNNSTDDTAAVAKAHGAIVRHEPRQGKGNVVRTMFRDVDAQYYVLVDGDDTYPAEAVGQLLEPLVCGAADMTVGDRLSNGTYAKENRRAFHGFGNNLVRWLIQVFYGQAPSDIMTGYRAFTRTFVKTTPIVSQGFQVETELSIWAVSHQWRVANVSVAYRDRPAGSESKLSTVSDGAAVLKAIATLLRDGKPLLFFGLIGAALLLLGLVAGIPVIFEFMATGLVPRLPTAVLAVALVICAALSTTCGIVLDSMVRSSRRLWELQVYGQLEAERRR